MVAEQNTPATEDLQTVQMQLKPATMKRLKQITELLGTDNGASAIASSILITEEVLRSINAGGKLYVENPDGQRFRLTLTKSA